MPRQLDFIKDNPAAVAQMWRASAETARTDPHWSPEERERRAAYYEQQARRIETGQCPPDAA